MADFLFSDQERREPRPVIVLSANSYNEDNTDVIVCGVTTNLGHLHHIQIKKTDLSSGQLKPESGARADMLGRLSKSEIRFKLGHITDEYHKQLLEKIVELIK